MERGILVHANVNYMTPRKNNITVQTKTVLFPSQTKLREIMHVVVSAAKLRIRCVPSVQIKYATKYYSS